jgi:hypothetical protein
MALMTDGIRASLDHLKRAVSGPSNSESRSALASDVLPVPVLK